VDLANAKGHGSEVVAAIVVACVFFVGIAVFCGYAILGLCIGTALFLGMPLIILFGLDDKSRGHRHRRH
jgi:Kef-type K+ transport system membrane component KefB